MTDHVRESSIPSGPAGLFAGATGSVPRVVFVHAGLADRRSWYPVMKLLGEPSLAYDRRGFGRTPAAVGAYSQGDDLVAVLDAAFTRTVTLVGSSQGGRIAIDFALAHPDRVDGLVLVGPAVSGAPPTDWEGELGPAMVTAIEAAEEAGDLDAVNRWEARIWLDGPSGRKGRVAGPVRDLFLDMNRIALANESQAEAREPPSA